MEQLNCLSLEKTNLIQFSVLQAALTNNFIKIEDFLCSLKREIDCLQKDNSILNQKLKQIQQQKIIAQSKQKNLQKEAQQIKLSREDRKNNARMKMRGILQDSTNVHPDKTESTGIGKLRMNKENITSSFQRRVSESQKQKQRFSDYDENEEYQEGFVSLELRIQELEKGKLYLEQKINKMLIDSAGGKKLLKSKIKKIGISKGNLGTLKTLKNLQEQGDQIITKTKSKVENNQNQQSSQKQQNSEDILNHIQDLCQEDLTEYIINKLKLILEEQKSSQTKVKQLQENQTFLTKCQEIFKRDLENVQTGVRQIQIRSLDSVAHPTTQKTKKGTVDQQSRVLNDTMESNRAFYQDKLIQLFDQMDRIKKQYISIAEKLNDEEGRDQKSLALRIQERTTQNQSNEPLKKQLVQNRRELKKLRQQFDRLLYGVNTGSNQIRTVLIKPNQTKEDWKSLTTKINKTKTDLTSSFRQLEGKITVNNQMIATINELQVSIGECKLVLQRKCQTADYQKGIKRLQSRLNNFIRQIYEKEGISNQKDAMIAKQPWFCLSCDNQLKNYTGKMLRPKQNNQIMHGKKVNPESHMVRRGQSKIPTLPSFYGKQ